MVVTRAGNYPDYGSQGSIKLTEQLYAKKLRNAYYKKDVIPFITNTDADAAGIKAQGDKVIFRNYPDISIYNYSKGQTINFQNAQSTTVELDIDKAKGFALAMDSIDKFQADIDYMSKWAEHGAKQLKESIGTAFFADVYDDFATYNYGASAGLISQNINLGVANTPRVLTKDNILYFMNDCAQVLDEQNVPSENRHITIPPAMWNLMMSSDLKNAAFAGNGKSAILGGASVGSLAGMEIHVTNCINSATDGSYKVFDVIANHMDAIAFCMQITETKFIESLETTHGSGMKALSVYGYKVVSPKAGLWAYVAIQN